MVNEELEEEAFRDRIATIDESGDRVWIFPKKPSGKFYNYRKIVSYSLLVLLFAAPHIKIGGEPLFLFNILERKFVVFGKIFWPQDLYLFAIAMVVGVIFVVLFTIIFGRLFCGWVCPQTIFMEMVFRRIEYWIEGDWTHQKKLANAPWNADKIRKRLIKHVIFWVISFLIANTFLAYIIGADQLWAIQTGEFSEHVGGFISLVIFTTVFYFVFTRLREQVCTTICPYGRLQGVLLDPNSMVVAYDHKRGEDRAKFKKNEDRSVFGKGDCIDCHQCVNVCPTGIDIRNGTQLECVNCTACIDECDHMMEGVGLEKGLIRFVSENGIANGTRFEWTRRVKAYSALLIALLGVLIVLLVTRSDFHATIMRQRGTTYHVTKDGNLGNVFELNLTNKTKKSYNVVLKTEDPVVQIQLVVDDLRLKSEGHLKERFVVRAPFSLLKKGMKEIEVIVYGNGEEIERVRTKLIGPII